MNHPARMQRSRSNPPAKGREPKERSRAPAGPPETSAGAAGDDHEWVRRAQAGDERAFEVLVRRHQARALRVARNLVADADEAQDLAQEAFLRVFRSLDRFDFQHEFSTWLY